MKHTKGPWEAHISDDGGFGIWADCFVVSSRNGYPDWDKSEVSRANAHLIAASPMLYETLIELYYRARNKLDCTGRYEIILSSKEYSELEKLLNKAKGE